MTGVLVVVACVAHQQVATRDVEPPHPPYRRVHDRETRELRLYGKLETELVLWATLLTDDVRRAGATELAYRGAMTAPEAESFVARSVAEGADVWAVVFAAMRSHEDARDFGIAETDPWRVRLRAGASECTPIAVERIETPTAAERVLYSQVNSWSDLWRATFQKDCGASGAMVFSIAGPYASGEVRWSL